jgi:hypothetical protein
MAPALLFFKAGLGFTPNALVTTKDETIRRDLTDVNFMVEFDMDWRFNEIKRVLLPIFPFFPDTEASKRMLKRNVRFREAAKIRPQSRADLFDSKANFRGFRVVAEAKILACL